MAMARVTDDCKLLSFSALTNIIELRDRGERRESGGHLPRVVGLKFQLPMLIVVR